SRERLDQTDHRRIGVRCQTGSALAGDLDQAPVGEPWHEQLGQAREGRAVVERLAQYLARLGEQGEPAPGERLRLVEMAVVNGQSDPACREPDELHLVPPERPR